MGTDAQLDPGHDQTPEPRPWDLITIGRVSVDLYSPEPGAGFEVSQTFVKSVGGSPTNVAVGAARLGLRAAAVTGVGDDGFGSFVRHRLASHGVDTGFVRVVPNSQTPLAIVALAPPQTPQIAFYRPEPAPDTCLTADLIDDSTLRSVRALWVSHAALSTGSTAAAVQGWLERRGRVHDRGAAPSSAQGFGAQTHYTLLDLDHRPALWADPARARRSAREAIARCDVVVGNQQECEVALGTSNPDEAADNLLTAGVSLAVVKLGDDGVLLATADLRLRIPSRPVPVVCGLGAGDAFGAALVRGLLAGHDLEQIGRASSAAGAFVVQRLTCSDDMPSSADLAQAQR